MGCRNLISEASPLGPGSPHRPRRFPAPALGREGAHVPSSHPLAPRWQDTPPATPQPTGDLPRPRASPSLEAAGTPWQPSSCRVLCRCPRPAPCPLGGHGPCRDTSDSWPTASLEPITFSALSPSPLRSSPAHPRAPGPAPRPPREPRSALPLGGQVPRGPEPDFFGPSQGHRLRRPSPCRGPAAMQRRPSARDTHPEVTGRRCGEGSEPPRRRARRLPSPPAL